MSAHGNTNKKNQKSNVFTQSNPSPVIVPHFSYLPELKSWPWFIAAKSCWNSLIGFPQDSLAVRIGLDSYSEKLPNLKGSETKPHRRDSLSERKFTFISSKSKYHRSQTTLLQFYLRWSLSWAIFQHSNLLRTLRCFTLKKSTFEISQISEILSTENASNGDIHGAKFGVIETMRSTVAGVSQD